MLELVAVPFPTGIEPKSPILQVDSLPAKPPGKPKNIGVGNILFPLQWIFLTQELKWGLWIAGGFFTSWMGYNKSDVFNLGVTSS